MKGKRHYVRSAKDVLRRRFGASVAEVDHHDLWQRATLTAALTSGSLANLTVAADRVERWLQARCPECVHVRRTVTSVEELHDLVPSFGREG